MSRWQDHCNLIIAFEETLRLQPRWREFCDWLDTEGVAPDFLGDLVTALQKGLASYDRNKGKSLDYWVTVWHLRPVVTKKYVHLYGKWRKERGLRLLSLDQDLGEGLRGTDLVFDDYEDPVTGETTDGSRSQHTRYRYDDVEPVATPLTTITQRSLLYRIVWRTSANSRSPQREVPETATDRSVRGGQAEPGCTQAPLTRRFWWRALTQ